MFIRIVTLEPNELVDDNDKIFDLGLKIEKQLQDAGVLDKGISIFFITGAFNVKSKYTFDRYLSELSMPINQKEYDFLSKDDNWQNYQYFVVEFYKYRLVHIPKTAGRHFRQKYTIYREGQNQNHTTFKSIKYKESVGLGNYSYSIKGSRMHDGENPFNLNYSSRRLSIVRNPYDWLVSMYFCNWDTNKSRGWSDVRDILQNYAEDSFEEFINVICDETRKDTTLYDKIMTEVFPFNEGLTTQLFDDDNVLCVSNIIFFERLHDGAKELNLQEKLDSDLSLLSDQDDFSTHLKCDPSSTREEGYKQYYTPDMVDKVAKAFKFDLEFLGYDFNGLRHGAKAFVYEPGIKKDQLPLLPI